MKVKIYRIDKDITLPKQANEGDAGYDLMAAQTVFFRPGEIKLIPTGIIAEAPKGFHFKLCLRSSMVYKKGFSLANSIGIIDNLFCGENDEIKVMLKAPNEGYDLKQHYGTEEKENEGVIYTLSFGCFVNKGDRIAQLILEKNNEIEWEEQEDRNFAGKSRGGFGSSGA